MNHDEGAQHNDKRYDCYDRACHDGIISLERTALLAVCGAYSLEFATAGYGQFVAGFACSSICLQYIVKRWGSTRVVAFEHRFYEG